MKTFDGSNWYVVNTRPLKEKKLAEILSQKKMEHYCPMKRLQRLSYNRVKMTYEPLFPSYVFVYVSTAELLRLKMINEVANVMYWQGRPAIIPDQEIDTIRYFLEHYNDITPEKMPVCTNTNISVMYSPRVPGKELVPEAINGFIKIQLPSLGFILKAGVTRELTMPVGNMELHGYMQSPMTKFAS